jgi:Asp-tRNA(Asn)/Glu-tRNA(Gln) amidotransferase B subunit
MAAEYEARRQIEILEDGGKIDQETRLYNAEKDETRSMRSKEDAHDYRYFPDPDLLPLELSGEYVERIRAKLPELPDQKRARFVKDYGLKDYDAGILAGDADKAAYFEAVAKGGDARLAANWVTQDLLGYLNKEGLELSQSPVSAAQLGGLVALIANNTISGKIAKDVFQKMIATGDTAAAIVEREGLKQVTDTGAIEKVVDEVDGRTDHEGQPGQGEPGGRKRDSDPETGTLDPLSRHLCRPAIPAQYPASLCVALAHQGVLCKQQSVASPPHVAGGQRPDGVFRTRRPRR